MPIKQELQPKQFPHVDHVRKAITQALQQVVLVENKAGTGKYFAIPNRGVEMQVGDTVGMLNVAWIGLKDAKLAEAASVERRKAQVASMTAEERKAWIAELQKGL